MIVCERVSNETLTIKEKFNCDREKRKQKKYFESFYRMYVFWFERRLMFYGMDVFDYPVTDLLVLLIR